jgi:hypothetical protein
MKIKNVFLALFAVTLLLGVTISSADAGVDTWPSCGEKVITTSGGQYYHPNFTLEENETGNPSTPYVFIFTSSNGWRIHEIYMEFSGSPIQHGTFPDGKTSYTTYGEKSSYVKVTLKKDCDYTPGCRSTDNYVFTLLGNYPCNLISGDKSIPARFLNPNYVNSLCNLPDLQFEWNGKWVKNTVKICDGYDIGGQYYDTRFGILP